MTRPRYRWSRKSLEELAAFYWETIAPRMLRDGFDPDAEPPTYEWLTEAGFSGLAYALREHHHLTLREFFVDVVGVGDETEGGDEGFTWGIDDAETIDAFESYLRAIDVRGGLAPRTVRTRRSHLAQFARTYRELHGAATIVDGLDDEATRRGEVDRCYGVFDVFHASLAPSTTLKYYQTVNDFYEYLIEHVRAAYNPVARFSARYNWETPDADAPTLDREDVRRLYDAAEDPEERLLVLALGAWGLRPNEVASLHVSQLVLDEAGDERIEFEERKNGPGSVALMFGTDALEERVLGLDGDGWSGYLFPSSRSASGHITAATVNNRFKRLCERVGVTVDGDTPTAKMGRRFWYTTYKDAIDDLVTRLEGVAADQGSASAEVVVSNYLSDEALRQYRRDAMRETLATVFETDAPSTE